MADALKNNMAGSQSNRAQRCRTIESAPLHLVTSSSRTETSLSELGLYVEKDPTASEFWVDRMMTEKLTWSSAFHNQSGLTGSYRDGRGAISHLLSVFQRD